MKQSKPKAYSYIRFSSADQKKGDSERRQIEDAKAYAKKHGLELDSTLDMKDKGVSGFTGKHIKEGALGKFLVLAKAGKIPKGSRLIVESIDRLGRQEPLEATDNIKMILRANIMLVVLDWYRAREFTNESIKNNPGEYSGLVAEIERAYFESKRKSEMLSKAWKEKRKLAKNGKKKLSGMSPMWLEISDDKKSFIVQPDIVEAITLMFQKKTNGKGAYKIEREMNENKKVYHPPKSKRNKNGAWRKSTINRYLKDRRLLGEYQPCTKVDGKREAVGDVITDYYPKVINEDLFYKVQAIFKQNSRKNGRGGGRKSVSNLFQHVVKCGHCGDSMQFENKGKWKYLRCDRNRRGLGCKESNSIRYDGGFEPLILKLCTELDAADILPGSEETQSQLAVAQKQLQAVTAELDQLNEKEENLINAVTESSSKKARKRYDQKLEGVLTTQSEKQRVQQEITANIDRLQSSATQTKQRLQGIRELIKYMDELEGKKLFDLRTKLRHRIQQIIDQITITQDNDLRLSIQFTAGRELEYIIGNDGQVDVFDSEHSKQRQRKVDAKVAQALNRAQKKTG